MARWKVAPGVAPVGDVERMGARDRARLMGERDRQLAVLPAGEHDDYLGALRVEYPAFPIAGPCRCRVCVIES